MRKWYEIKLQADDESAADIHVTDFIGDWIDDYWGFGVTAKGFIDQLSKLPDAVRTIRLHVNSPGGDVFAALNIANALRDQRATKGRTVETVVDGLAASAASLLIMAGDPIRISDNGLVMIHQPWSVALGNAGEMRKMAETLDKLRDTIVATYRWKSQLSAEELIGLMDAETWMDADEAIARGFADEKIEGLRAAAGIDPRAAARLQVPERYAGRVAALLAPPEPVAAEPPAAEPAPVDPGPILQACSEAGLDLAFAQALIAAAPAPDAVAGCIAAEQDARARAAARAEEIRAVCAVAQQDDLAAGYVASGMTVGQMRDHVARITAKLDKAEIDAGLDPDHGTRRRPVIDVVAVYAERNRLRH